MGEVVAKYVWVFRDHVRRGFGLNIVEEVDGVESLVLLDGTRVDLAGQVWPERVTALMSEASAQRIMDQMWADGLRPSGVEGGAGVVDAMAAHLASKDAHIGDLWDILIRATSAPRLVDLSDKKDGA